MQQNSRRTWAGVPSSYVKEQRAIFEDVDAFDLDEKEAVCSPFAKKQQQQQQQMRDSLDFAKSQMLNYDLAYDEALRHSNLSESELLSAALRTPHRAVGKAEPKKIHIPVPSQESVSLNYPFWLSIDSRIDSDGDIPSPETLRDKPVTRRSSRLSAETAIHRDSSSRLSASSWISNDEEIQPPPDVYSWDQPMRRRSSRSSVDSGSQGRNSRSISSIDEEVPTPVGILTREDSAILDSETASLLNRMEALHIREGDSHNMLRKMSVCTPVSEEGEEEVEEVTEEEIHGVFRKISHCTPVPEECEEELDIHDTSSEDGHDASLQEDVPLSVFEVLLQECRQTEVLTLSEALSDFWW